LRRNLLGWALKDRVIRGDRKGNEITGANGAGSPLVKSAVGGLPAPVEAPPGSPLAAVVSCP
jgi:hypothetical protein